MPINYGPIVQGGALLGSTLLAGRQRPEERQAVQAGTDVLNLGLGTARNLLPTGQGFIRQGIGTMQPSLDYWRGLLQGGSATTAAAAPDIQRIGEQYDAVRRGQAELAPRGGGRASLLNELPYQRMRDVSNVITQQRAAAAPALAQAGGQIASTGSATINNAINSLYTSSQAGRELLDYAQKRQATDIEQGKGIGAGIVDIVKGAVPKWFETATGGASKGAGLLGSVVGGNIPEVPLSTIRTAAPGLIGGPGIPGGESLGMPQSAGGGSIISGVTGAVKTVGSTVGHGVSHLLGLAAGNPLAAAAIGAGIGGALLAKHFIGQGRRAADVLTRDGGMQRSFESALHEIDAMNIPDDQKWQHKREAYDGLVRMGLEHAKKGDNERKVVSQMFDTISPLFGQSNPLTHLSQSQTADVRGAVGSVVNKMF